MSGKVRFHGAFSDRKRAKEKAREVGGAVKPVTVRGSKRYRVETRE